jgi:Tfp pilus assembly protein FimV
MALRQQSLEKGHDTVVLRFPTAAVRRRVAARRRTLVLRRAAAACALAATLILVLLGSGGGTAQAIHVRSPRAVVVRHGQTLWDIASRYAPASIDPRAYMDEVLELNHLTTPPAGGVRIRLPRS